MFIPMTKPDRVLIIGANGFIGHHLATRLIKEDGFHVTAIDIKSNRLDNLANHSQFEFSYGDILSDSGWIDEAISKADVVVPLVAIATPMSYIRQPIKVFELDFEANLPIVRKCVSYNKHLLFPSTSEVYGMSPDLEFNSMTTNLVTGPIHMQRWIYSTCKQLMDRLIYAYGETEGLNYSIFRPFNWFGPGLDSVDTPREGGSRVVTNFIGSILRGENITLVNGGSQRRAFTYVDDGIDGLIKIIRNRKTTSNRAIFNLGNPSNDYSISHLATSLLQIAMEHPKLKQNAAKVKIVSEDESTYYGAGYQDVLSRNPDIKSTSSLLNWFPTINLQEGLARTLNHYSSETGL
jgi:nucleoside-diphosphate-sugar epimerase